MNDQGPVLAGYDGSDQARDGLALTRELATILEAEVIVLSVLNYAPTETFVDYERVLREQGRELRAEALATVRIPGPGRMTTEAVYGASPTRELHDLAEARDARMIVLGSSHRGPVGRVLPGAVVDRLLTAAPCAVAVAPRGYATATSTLRRIGVAYDGSPESGLALGLATELAQRADADLQLIVVADPHEAIAAVAVAGAWAGTATTQEGIERVQHRMEEVLRRGLGSSGAGIEATGDVITDADPTSVIAGASEHLDLLLMGSRGYGPLGRVLLGGVSSRVVRDAGCPVILTPRSLTEDDGRGSEGDDWAQRGADGAAR
jgi:nucleotide-binding universal stress UspA family protein